jgi:NAD-dependent dihydropyrimidine dehydrogenase PreA subunit
MPHKDIPREKIPWYPSIERSKCNGCRECFEFCQNGVFAWDDEKNCANVVKPFQCVVGCSACQNLCSEGAISFPNLQEIHEIIRKLREKS